MQWEIPKLTSIPLSPHSFHSSEGDRCASTLWLPPVFGVQPICLAVGKLGHSKAKAELAQHPQTKLSYDICNGIASGHQLLQLGSMGFQFPKDSWELGATAALGGGRFSGKAGKQKEACQLPTFPVLTAAFPPCEASASSMQCSDPGARQESKSLCIHWALVSATKRGTQGGAAVRERETNSPGKCWVLPCPACNRQVQHKLAEESQSRKGEGNQDGVGEEGKGMRAQPDPVMY